MFDVERDSPHGTMWNVLNISVNLKLVKRRVLWQLLTGRGLGGQPRPCEPRPAGASWSPQRHGGHGACFLSAFRGGELEETGKQRVRQMHEQRKRLRDMAPLDGIRKAAEDLEIVSARPLSVKIVPLKTERNSLCLFGARDL